MPDRIALANWAAHLRRRAALGHTEMPREGRQVQARVRRHVDKGIISAATAIVLQQNVDFFVPHSLSAFYVPVLLFRVRQIPRRDFAPGNSVNHETVLKILGRVRRKPE